MEIFALGSAVFAALTAWFGKIGVSEMSFNLATFIRTIVILILTGIMITFRGEWEAPTFLSHRGLGNLIDRSRRHTDGDLKKHYGYYSNFRVYKKSDAKY